MISDLSEWRTTFLNAGENGFKKNPEDRRIAEYERALGRVQIDLARVYGLSKNANIIYS